MKRYISYIPYPFLFWCEIRSPLGKSVPPWGSLPPWGSSPWGSSPPWGSLPTPFNFKRIHRVILAGILKSHLYPSPKRYIPPKKGYMCSNWERIYIKDRICCTKRFFDIISQIYPTWKYDIISYLYPAKWIYIRDIISLDIYPLQVCTCKYSRRNWQQRILRLGDKSGPGDFCQLRVNIYETIFC